MNEHLGCLLGLELVKDKQTREPCDESAKLVYQKAFRKGLTWLPAGHILVHLGVGAARVRSDDFSRSAALPTTKVVTTNPCRTYAKVYQAVAGWKPRQTLAECLLINQFAGLVERCPGLFVLHEFQAEQTA